MQKYPSRHTAKASPSTVRFFLLLVFVSAVAIWPAAAAPAHTFRLAQAAAASAAEIAFWESARASGNPDMIGAYLETYPQGHFKRLAEIMLSSLSEAAADQASGAIARCDELAANHSDKSHQVPAVKFATLKEHAGEAIAACKAAAETGNPRSVYQLGRAFHAAGRSEYAMQFFERAAGAGHLLATYWYAQYLQTGDHGLEKDAGRALILFERNANAGHAGSMWRAGQIYIYYNDQAGIAEDLTRAFTLFKQAVDAGNNDALKDLARAYEKGWGIQRDIEEAKRLYRRAVETTRYTAPRKNLAIILFDEISGPGQFAPFDTLAAKAEEMLTLVRGTVGNTEASHEYYLNAHVRWLAILTWRTFSYQALQRSPDPDQAKSDARWKRDLEGFMTALARRRDEFSGGRFDAQTGTALAEKAKELNRLFARLKEQTAEFHTIRAGMANVEHASDCVKTDSEWDRHTFELEFRNSCRFPVTVYYEIKFNGRVVRDSDVTLGPNKRKTVSKRGGNGGGTEAAYSWRVCAKNAVLEITSPGKYECQRSYIDDSPAAQTKTKIGGLLSKLLEGGI